MSDRHVIKRSGQKAILDITHIHKQTKPSCERNGVSQSELEVDLGIQLRDGITTVEIQSALEKAASDKISIEEPNWTFVAAEILLTGFYHTVGKQYKSNKQKYAHTLKEYFNMGEKYNRMLVGLSDAYADNFDELNDYLEPERDLQFTYLGAKTLVDRYLLRDSEHNVIELPQHMFMGIAMMLAYKEDPKVRVKWVKKFYDMISKFEVMMATPTLSNARTARHQMSSCYVGAMPDSIEGIFDSFDEMALLSKFGGGIGWDFNNVRSIGSFIDGHRGAAGGPIPFLNITNAIAIAVDQLGTRKGAIAPYLQPWHIDIVDFIDTKKNSGEERRRTHDLFPALWINDIFMQRVVDDGDWTLFDPYDVEDLSAAFSDDFEQRYLKYEKDSSIKKKTMRAKDLWKQILTSYFESGSPFLCFKDTANTRNPNSHTGNIRSSNLCVVGDSRILTKKHGHIAIENVSGTTQECWDGFNWADTPIFQTSEGQAVVTVNMSNGASLECTPYHKWSIAVQNSFGGFIGTVVKRTHELSIGDKLEKFDLSPIDHGLDTLPLAYENGFYTADGTRIKDNLVCGHKIYLYDKKMSLLSKFNGFAHESHKDERISLSYKHDDLCKKFFVPGNNYSVSSRLEWLAGYFDGDGTLTVNDGSESIQVASVNLEFLQELMLLLQEIGVHSTISEFKKAGYVELPLNDGSGKSGEFWCKEQRRLLISGSSLQDLLDVGYSANRVMPTRRKYNRSARRFTTITSVIDEGKVKPTYCGTSPNNNKLMFNGVLTMNCTEIFQNTEHGKYEVVSEFVDGTKLVFGEDDTVMVDAGYEKRASKLTPVDSINNKDILHSKKSQIDGTSRVATCNLASVNLSKINSKEDFERIIPIAVRALDNVVTLNFFPTRNTKVTSDATRSIGLGMMGEAEMIATKEITWGSSDHFNLIDEVCENFSFETIKASSDLAVTRGAYPEFEGSSWHRGELPIDTANQNAIDLLNRPFVNDWDWLRAKVKHDGMRNGYLMAIAPTSSISILTGTTQAVEPVYKRLWYEENLSGLIPNVVPNLNAATWQHYVPAYDIDQKLIIKAGAIRQKWLDQGQSLNLFFKAEITTARKLSEVYILAWLLGLKSTYYLRSQSPETANDTEDRSMECVGCQ